MASWKGEMLGEAIASVAAERPDAIGINCTLSPSEMLGLIDSLIQAAGGIQTLCEPNRGMPEYIDGEAKYLLSAQDFASGVEAIYSKGVHIVGGCCGSDPECIRLISQRLF
jgi:5-methyltetrahydrofolate--homocysteine methyltransferase